MKNKAARPNELTRAKREKAREIIAEYVAKYIPELTEKDRAEMISAAMNEYFFNLLDAAPIRDAFQTAGIA